MSSIEPGGAADRAGVRANDRIVAVNGQPLAGVSSEEAAAIIAGTTSAVRLLLGHIRVLTWH